MAKFVALLNRYLNNTLSLEEFQADYFDLWEAMRDKLPLTLDQVWAGDDIYNALNAEFIDEFELETLARAALDLFLDTEI